MKEREELSKELFEAYNNAKTESVYDNDTRWLAVADYVIKDRKRIVDPMVKSEYYHQGGSILVDMKTVSDLLNIGCKVLNRAGLGD